MENVKEELMNFTQEDRDMLKIHNFKLQALCLELEVMNTLLKKIDSSSGSTAISCVESRAACRKEIDKDYIKQKTFWVVIGVIVIGFIGKLILNV